MEWFQIRKAVRQGCILSPGLFNVYAEYIMWNARLDEVQDGLKISRRNINKLRYADDTILMAESKEDLKSLLMKVKEESEKVGLNLKSQKTKIMASYPITSWQVDGKWIERVANFIFGELPITADVTPTSVPLPNCCKSITELIVCIAAKGIFQSTLIYLDTM